MGGGEWEIYCRKNHPPLSGEISPQFQPFIFRFLVQCVLIQWLASNFRPSYYSGVNSLEMKDRVREILGTCFADFLKKDTLNQVVERQ